ncbi:MAG: hypothetical protein WDN66_00210 [Candidatus Saccharibacteria bacterium]
MTGEQLTVRERVEAGELVWLEDAQDLDTDIPHFFWAGGCTNSGFITGRKQLERAVNTYGEDAVLVDAPLHAPRNPHEPRENRFGMYVVMQAYELVRDAQDALELARD